MTKVLPKNYETNEIFTPNDETLGDEKGYKFDKKWDGKKLVDWKGNTKAFKTHGKESLTNPLPKYLFGQEKIRVSNLKAPFMGYQKAKCR
jgi:hypothetical protein